MTRVYKQLIRFAIVGIANTLIGLTSIYGMMYFFNINLIAANAIGYTIGLFISFMLNKTWTFKNSKKMTTVLPTYIALAAVSYSVNLGIVILAHTELALNPYLSQGAGIAFYTTIMFIGSRWIFRNANVQSTQAKV